MGENYMEAMMELCMSLGSATYHGQTHNEEEALLYRQLCRTISAKAKIDEESIEEARAINEENKRKTSDGEETGAPV